MDHMGRAGLRPALAGPGQLVGQLLDAAADVGLEMLGPLVLGHRPQHLPQPGQAVLRRARRAEVGLGSLVLGRDVVGMAAQARGRAAPQLTPWALAPWARSPSGGMAAGRTSFPAENCGRWP